MNIIARSLAAFAYLVSSTLAHAGFVINPFFTTSPSITFLQCAADVTNLTTYTFATQNTGTASSDRYTLVGVTGEDDATAFTVSTVTVGGDSATELTEDAGAGVSINSAMYLVANTAGTSEEIVVTFSEAITAAAICLWQVNNLTSGTAHDVASDTAAGGGAASLAMDFNALGVGAAICGNTGDTNTFTWTGMTESSDADLGEHRVSSAEHTDTGAGETARAIDCDPSGNSTAGSAVSLK